MTSSSAPEDWQQDTSNSTNFEYFDTTTGENRITAGIVADERVNEPQIINLGVHRRSTLEFDFDPTDGIIDIPSVPGLNNILLIANGDNDDRFTGRYLQQFRAFQRTVFLPLWK